MPPSRSTRNLGSVRGVAKITYNGPDDFYVARDGERRVTLRRSQEVEVSEELAAHLHKARGHNFAVSEAKGSKGESSQGQAAE